MTQALYNYFMIGSLGVLLQILSKIKTLQVKSKLANHNFSFKEYFSDDWATIAASFVSVLILCYCLDEILAVKPVLVDYIKWLFVFVGFTGSSVIQSLFSVTSKKINDIIDIKTNLADDVKPAVDATNKDGLVEMEKDAAMPK